VRLLGSCPSDRDPCLGDEGFQDYGFFLEDIRAERFDMKRDSRFHVGKRLFIRGAFTHNHTFQP